MPAISGKKTGRQWPGRDLSDEHRQQATSGWFWSWVAGGFWASTFAPSIRKPWPRSAISPIRTSWPECWMLMKFEVVIELRGANGPAQCGLVRGPSGGKPFQVNVTGAAGGDACLSGDAGAYLVHVSSGCIYRKETMAAPGSRKTTRRTSPGAFTLGPRVGPNISSGTFPCLTLRAAHAVRRIAVGAEPDREVAQVPPRLDGAQLDDAPARFPGEVSEAAHPAAGPSRGLRQHRERRSDVAL